MIRLLRRLLGCRCEEHRARITELTRPQVTTARGCRAPVYRSSVPLELLIDNIAQHSADAIMERIFPEPSDDTVTDLAAEDKPRRGRPRKAGPAKAKATKPREMRRWSQEDHNLLVQEMQKGGDWQERTAKMLNCTPNSVKVRASRLKTSGRIRPTLVDGPPPAPDFAMTDEGEIITNLPAGQDKERDEAVKRTQDMKALLLAIRRGDKVTVDCGDMITERLVVASTQHCLSLQGGLSIAIGDLITGNARIVAHEPGMEAVS